MTASANSLVLITLLVMHQMVVDTAQASATYKAIQTKNLYQPAAYVVNREARGVVTIYDGFTSGEVDQAMDEHYDRIENMMFTRVVMTDEPGGDFVVDDGCD